MVDMADAAQHVITMQATGAAAEMWPQYLGDFVATTVVARYTEMEDLATSVYGNSHGKYLYKWDDTWLTGNWVSDLKSTAFMSVGSASASCPSNLTKWKFLEDRGWRPGDITIKCNIHS